MFRRLLYRLLNLTVRTVGPQLTAEPYAVRFRRFVIVLIPGAGAFQITHEQAAVLAEQLSPNAKH